MQPGGVGGEHPQVAGEHLGLVRVFTPAKLQMPVNEVRMVEHPGIPGCGLEEDAGLLPRARRAVHRGVLHGDEMVQRDQREKVRLPLPSGQHRHDFALIPGDCLCDPVLEWL